MPAGAGVGMMKEVRAQPADPARRVRAGAAHRVRERRQPAARARGGAARPDRGAAGHGRVAAADRDRGAGRERPARAGRRRSPGSSSRSARRGCCSRWRSPARRSCRSTRRRRRWCWRSRLAWRSSPAFCSAPRRRGLRRAPIRSRRCAAPAARMGDRASFTRKALLVVQATLSVVLVAGSTMLGRSLGNLEGQDFGFEIPAACWSRSAGRRRPSRRNGSPRSIATSRSGSPACRRARRRSRALQPADRQLGRRGARRRQAGAGAGRQAGASWDRVSANYLQHLGVKLVRGRYFTDADNETVGERRRRERSVRRALLQAGRGSDRSALRPEPARERQHLPHRRRRRRRQVRGLPTRSAGAADVLRAAGADGGLQATS